MLLFMPVEQLISFIRGLLIILDRIIIAVDFTAPIDTDHTKTSQSANGHSDRRQRKR
jgi:hypothetical protein